jgi:hypothetical protein
MIPRGNRRSKHRSQKRKSRFQTRADFARLCNVKNAFFKTTPDILFFSDLKKIIAKIY